MGVKLMTSVVIASVSGVAAVAAAVPVPHLPIINLGESISAVVAGSLLIVLCSSMRRTRVAKYVFTELHICFHASAGAPCKSYTILGRSPVTARPSRFLKYGWSKHFRKWQHPCGSAGRAAHSFRTPPAVVAHSTV